MDALHLDFAAKSFDVVIDKGTIDALSCSPQCWAVIRDTNKEVQRVLAPNGTYVVFSYASPEVRFPHFQRRCFTWDATATKISACQIVVSTHGPVRAGQGHAVPHVRHEEATG